MGATRHGCLVSEFFPPVSIKARPLLNCMRSEFVVLTTYSGKPDLGNSITRMTTRALGVERWRE